MLKNIKITEMVEYAGHSLKANGSVDFNLKAPYSELVKTINVMQMLNNDIEIKAKVAKRVLELGSFRIKQIIIDGDGESKLRFNGLSDYIEMDNLNSLPLASDDVKEFKILMEAEIESEEEENE